MDIPTRNLSMYVKEIGVNLSELSRKTDIPYVSLYDSLVNEKRKRNLRAGEFLKICEQLKVDPKDFDDKGA